MEHSYKRIEEIIIPYKEVIGKDYHRYKNHVCRVFLHCILFDNQKSNEEKYAIAAVFHDIGIWTAHTIDYLEPSIQELKSFLIASNKEEWTDEISEMIYWHHKINRYQNGRYASVEIFRKADWIDVSLGIITFGIPSKEINWIKKSLPNSGFHWFLIKKIARNLFKHPLNPLPMFKK